MRHRVLLHSLTHTPAFLLRGIRTRFFENEPSYRKLFAILFSRAGIDLGELKVWLSDKYPLVAADYRAGEYTIDNLRNQIVNSLNTERAAKSVALVNFHGSHMGLLMKGHFSVIAGYDEVTDSVLVLDVAKHRLPDYWVPMANLYEGMQAIDGKSHRSRGLLIISNRKMSCGDFYLKL